MGEVRTAAACGTGLTAVLVLATGSMLDRPDGAAMDALAAAAPTPLASVSGAVVSIADPRQAVLLLAATSVMALIVGGFARALTACVLLLAANGVGLLLDGCCVRTFVTPDGAVAQASAPSNHLLAVASCTAALALVVPRALLGPLVACGTSATALVGAGLLITRTHAPSDLLASLLLVGAVTGVATHARRRGVRHRPLSAPGAAAVLIAGAAVIGLIVHERAPREVEAVARAMLDAPGAIAPVAVAGVLAGLLAHLCIGRSST